MLKVRVIPTLLYKDFGLVKGKAFDSWRPVGGLMQSIKVYNLRGVDELAFLDIRATLEGRAPDYDLVDDFADECFMPLTVGGGVRTVDQVRRLLTVGADKVALNMAAVGEPRIIREAADRFGSQCVVVSIDAKHIPGVGHEVFTHAGTRGTGLDPVTHAKSVEALGAGEILLTSIDRDGTQDGYDLELLEAVRSAVPVPVIASGGAGTIEHCVMALAVNRADAVLAASIFHRRQIGIADLKRGLAAAGIPVRPIEVAP